MAQAGRFGAVTIATNMAGRGTDIILGGVPDHRDEGDPGREGDRLRTRPTPEQRQAALDQVLERDGGASTRRRSASASTTPEERAHPRQALPGHPGRRSPPDHPSVQAVTAVAREGTALRAYLTPRASCPARPRRRSPSAFYPQIENPVDFLAVHPLKATLEEHRAAAEFAQGRGAPRRATSASAWWPWAASTSSPPSATRPAASTTSCAAAPAARATPARRASTCRSQDDLMRIFGSERISGLMLKLGMEEGIPIEHGMVTPLDRARAAAGGGAELRGPQAPARVRRRDEQAAHGGLRHAPHGPRGQEHPRARPRA